VLITTSTNDDRVHPGHARKMAASLEAADHQVLYYENTEGGHAGASNKAQAAFENAVIYEFLLQTLSQ
jgi:prolyl oligopeptidase